MLFSHSHDKRAQQIGQRRVLARSEVGRTNQAMFDGHQAMFCEENKLLGPLEQTPRALQRVGVAIPAQCRNHAGMTRIQPVS